MNIGTIGHKDVLKTILSANAKIIIDVNKNKDSEELYNPFTPSELEKMRREAIERENAQSYKYIPSDKIFL